MVRQQTSQGERPPGLAADIQSLTEGKFDERVQPCNVIDMEMADEQKDGFIPGDVPVRLCNAIAGIQDDVIVLCLDEDRARIAGHGIVPAVGAKESDLYGYVSVCNQASRFRWPRCLFIHERLCSLYNNNVEV